MSLSHEFLDVPYSQVEQLMSLSAIYDKDVRFGRLDKIVWPTNNQAEKLKRELALLTGYYKERRCNSITIADEFILPFLTELEQVNTFMDGFIPYRGLNYYGFTIVAPDNLACLINTFANLPFKKRYVRLIELCETATALGRCILHCGI